MRRTGPRLSLRPPRRAIWLLALALAALAAGALYTAPLEREGLLPAPSVDPASHQGYTESLADGKVRFDMVAVPGGTFRMGSHLAEKGRGVEEGPRRAVRVRPFWMGRTEVTWDEYDLFRAEGVPAVPAKDSPDGEAFDAVTCPSPSYIDEYRGFGSKGHPVVGVSHHAAMQYCLWLSYKTGKVYRLPTEAEWEFACRAGGQGPYFFGDDAGKLGDYAWYEPNARERTHPVGSKKPNPWGLYDLYGNVAEWCLDHYDKERYQSLPLDNATLGPVKLPGADRYPHVVRGGCWADSASGCRSASRRGSDPNWNRSDPSKPKSIWWLGDCDFVGFRVVRAVEEQDELKRLRSKVTKQSK
jgi:formylglycine-generating enzyme required for sulfatase activity